jgi:hypothetical protein
VSTYTLHDTEDGEPLCVVEYENRRDGDGQKLGKKPGWLMRMFYDLKQIRRVVEPRLPKETPADTQNQDISGP